MSDFTEDDVYRSMTRKDLFALRAAFQFDYQTAKHPATRTFCRLRMELISRAINAKESGRPCGCDPGENYECEQHQRADVVFP